MIWHCLSVRQAMLERIDDQFAVSLEDRLAGLGVADAPVSSEPSLSHLVQESSHSASSGRGSAAEQQAARREAAAARREAERAVFAKAKAAVYYRRQLLGLSLQGRRVDLITITDKANVGDDDAMEEDLPPDCFPSASEPACHAFNGKKVLVHAAKAPAHSCPFPCPLPLAKTIVLRQIGATHCGCPLRGCLPSSCHAVACF